MIMRIYINNQKIKNVHTTPLQTKWKQYHRLPPLVPSWTQWIKSPVCHAVSSFCLFFTAESFQFERHGSIFWFCRLFHSGIEQVSLWHILLNLKYKWILLKGYEYARSFIFIYRAPLFVICEYQYGLFTWILTFNEELHVQFVKHYNAICSLSVLPPVIKLHKPNDEVGASSSVTAWGVMARSLSTETKENTQVIEDHRKEDHTGQT